MFGKKQTKVQLAPGSRVILFAGAAGAVGTAVLARQPANAVVVNISRTHVAMQPGVITCLFDLVKEPERAFQHLAGLLPYVDVFVYAAYEKRRSAFESIERAPFLAEYELNVYAAATCARLCAEHFWRGDIERNRARARKAIFFSSTAAFGKMAKPENASYSAAKAALNALAPYAHDYLWGTYGASVHVLAPGSTADSSVRNRLADKFWELATQPHDSYTLDKISEQP